MLQVPRRSAPAVALFGARGPICDAMLAQASQSGSSEAAVRRIRDTYGIAFCASMN